MKKSIFFVAALALTFAACNQNEPEKYLQMADFENVTVSADSICLLSETGTFASGGYKFDQEVSNSDWGTYYYGNVVSSKKDKMYHQDYQNYMSAAGGAFSGNNFVVWYLAFEGHDRIHLSEASVVPGFYVCNTPWVIDAVKNGDGMSEDGGKPFGKDDYLNLTIHGYLQGKAVNHEVVFKLVDGTTPVTEWTYVSLSELGKVDEISFSMEGTKKNSYGLTTPTYFAMDNFGSKK